MAAVAFSPPPLARTLAVPVPVAGAVYSPPLLTLPEPPAIDQVQAGWVLIAWPNWSSAVAVNCWLVPSCTLAVAGRPTTPARVLFTVTLALLDAAHPPAPRTATLTRD